MDAYQLCSQIAKVPVANVVDANYSVVVKAPKALLPPVDAFDGIHADLRRPRPVARHHLTTSPLLSPHPGRPAPWICSSTAPASSSPAAPVASAGPSSRPSSTKAPPSASARATPTRSPQPSKPCRTAAASPAASLDVGDADALAAWVEESADGVRRARRGGRQRQRPRHPRHRGELAGQPQRRPHAHGPPRARGDAAPRAQRRLPPSSPSPASPGASRTSPPGPYGTAKTAIVGYINGLALQLAEKGIRANTVSPGNTYFEGGVWASIESGNPDLFETAVGLNPTGHMGTPEEIAGAGGLPGQPQARRVSGTNLVVDGALTRGIQL